MGDSLDVLNIADVIAAMSKAQRDHADLSETVRAEQASKNQAVEMELGQLLIQKRDEAINHLFKDATARADWSGVIKSARELLIATLNSRMLVILIEALTQEHGWPGFETGLQLFRVVLDTFPEQLQPVPDSTGNRLGRYSSLLKGNDPVGQFVKMPTLALDRISWFELNGRRISFADFRADVRSGRQTPTEVEISQAIAAMPAELKLQWLAAAQSTLVELARFSGTVKTDLTRDSRSSPEMQEKNVKKLTDWQLATERIVTGLIKEFQSRFGVAAVPDTNDAQPQTAVASNLAGAAVSVSTTPIPIQMPQTRESALAELNAAATYFENADPHSIASYHMRRAERWMKMPVTAVLVELVGESHEIYQMLPKGVLAPSSPATALVPDTETLKSDATEQTAGLASETTSVNLGNQKGCAATTAGAVMDRADAIKRVESVLGYLGRFEPHSFAKFPLAFAVEIANIPIDRILEGAIVDEKVRAALLREIGATFFKAAAKK